MKKRHIIIFLIILFLIGGIILFLSNIKKETLAVGTTLSEIVMAKGDATSSWNVGDSGVYKTNLNSSTGLYHDYRYIGPNVDNYVKFNNDIYRIIGVFDDYSHGVQGKYLVKLIRSRPIGFYTLGVYNTNNLDGIYAGYSDDWTGEGNPDDSSDDVSPFNVNVLLNEFFYNKTYTSSTFGICENWTYYLANLSASSTIYRTEDCSDIVGYGIAPGMRNYIEDVTWYLNGFNSNNSTTNFSIDSVYSCEREGASSVLTCGVSTQGTFSSSTLAKIGLPYASDFLYSSSLYGGETTSVSRQYRSIANLFAYSWLNIANGYSITPNYGLGSRYAIDYWGKLSSFETNASLDIYPTFYLKSSVYVTGGTGAYDDPYIIACGDCNA